MKKKLGKFYNIKINKNQVKDKDKDEVKDNVQVNFFSKYTYLHN